MGEWFNDLSLQEKILYAGGGVLVLLLLFRSLGGAKQTTDSGTLVDQSQATAQAEQAFEQNVSKQIQDSNAAQSKAIQDQTAGILSMFSGFQDMQTKTTENLAAKIDTSVANQNSKIDSLLSKMATPNYYGNALPKSSGGSSSIGGVTNTKEDTRPSVTVVPGSADERILKVQYGDSIKFNYSATNQFSGADRIATNAAFQKELASKGVTPTGSAGNLWNYGKGLGEN